MATLNRSITYPERPELTVTLEALHRLAEAAVDSAAETTVAYATLREAVRDLLMFVEYNEYHVHIRNEEALLQTLRRLDALIGGGR